MVRLLNRRVSTSCVKRTLGPNRKSYNTKSKQLIHAHAERLLIKIMAKSQNLGRTSATTDTKRNNLYTRKAIFEDAVHVLRKLHTGLERVKMKNI